MNLFADVQKELDRLLSQRKEHLKYSLSFPYLFFPKSVYKIKEEKDNVESLQDQVNKILMEEQMRRIKGSKVYEHSPKEWEEVKKRAKEENIRIEGMKDLNVKVNQSSGDYGLSAHTRPSTIFTEDDYAKFGRANPIVYSAPSGSAYPSEPILTTKASGWVGVFGEHYLCELGCKKFVSKKLDDVIKFIEKEIRHYYHAREVGRAIKSKPKKEEVEVRSYIRKPRKKKEQTPDDEETKRPNWSPVDAVDDVVDEKK